MKILVIFSLIFLFVSLSRSFDTRLSGTTLKLNAIGLTYTYEKQKGSYFTNFDHTLLAPKGASLSITCSNVKLDCYKYNIIIGNAKNDNLAEVCNVLTYTRKDVGRKLKFTFKKFVDSWEFDTGSSYSCKVTVDAASENPEQPIYNPSRCVCGQLKETVDGKLPNSAPWNVLVHLHNDALSHKCGGSIISENLVLTAASCLRQFDYNVNKNIDIYYNVKGLSAEKDLPSSDPIKVVWDYVYWYADGPYGMNDLALLRVETPISFSEDVMPVCLPPYYRDSWHTGYGIYGNAPVDVISFGFDATGADGFEDKSNSQKRVDLTMLPYPDCRKAYPKLPQNEITNYWFPIDDVDGRLFCTVAKVGEVAALGFMGSTIDYKDPVNGLYYALAIGGTNKFIKDNSQPRYQTRLHDFLEFIWRITEGETFCLI